MVMDDLDVIIKLTPKQIILTFRTENRFMDSLLLYGFDLILDLLQQE